MLYLPTFTTNYLNRCARAKTRFSGSVGVLFACFIWCFGARHSCNGSARISRIYFNLRNIIKLIFPSFNIHYPCMYVCEQRALVKPKINVFQNKLFMNKISIFSKATFFTHRPTFLTRFSVDFFYSLSFFPFPLFFWNSCLCSSLCFSKFIAT